MNDRKKVSKLLLACQLAFATSLIPLATTQAASIIWQAPQRIKGNTDVLTQGQLLGAYSFSAGTAGGAVSTVNGVPFVVTPFNVFQNYNNAALGLNTKLKGNVASPGGLFGGFNSTVAPYVGLSYEYRQILTRGIYGSGNIISLTFDDLQENTTYLIQLWLNDSRGHQSTQSAVTFSTGSAPSFPSAKVDAMESFGVAGKVGQYIAGYLTTGAGETSVTITATPNGGASQVNAVQIRTASGSTAWMTDAKYGIMLHYQIGGVLGPAWGPLPSYSEQASVYQVGGNKPQSEWSEKVNNFKVADFADDAAAAGAGWVIISVGSKYGYYSSHNGTYETAGGALGGIPLIKGEFTPKPDGGAVDGDLILSLGTALKAKGIPLFVYMASEGPWDANTVVRSDGTSVQMKFATLARGGSPAWSPGAHPDFQTFLRAMITEWSTRWGSNVAGWWFDGTFSGTGYAANGIAVGGGPIGAVTALGNLDGLVTAAKSGNPSALVALNPGFNNLSALSETQDYLAGEWAAGGAAPSPSPAVYADQPNGKFATYPTSQTVAVGAKNVQWHTLSFLGDNWRGPRKAYANEELTSYISKVNSVGGAVTLDVYYLIDGRIPKVFMDQLRAVKATLKPNAVPAATPAAPAVNFANLALFKPAYFRASTMSDPELRALGEGTWRANAGNDGNYRSIAEASPTGTPPSLNYLYSYIVDLGTAQNFDRIVFVPGGHYAPSYSLAYSSDGVNWTDFNAASYSVGSNDIRLHDSIGTKNGRYIRVKSLTSDSYSVAMSIAELEVYNTGGVAAGADTVWMDDYIFGSRQHPAKPISLVTLTGTWTWFDVMATTYDPLNPGLYPQPRDGVRYHVSEGPGITEHGFNDTPAILKLGANDVLYCWVWVAEAPSEIRLKWTATDGTEGRARWGGDTISGSGYYVDNVPAANAAPVANMPPENTPGDTGQWVRLSVPASSVGLAGKSLKGMSFAVDGGKVFFDRIGKMTP